MIHKHRKPTENHNKNDLFGLLPRTQHAKGDEGHDDDCPDRFCVIGGKSKRNRVHVITLLCYTRFGFKTRNDPKSV